MKTDMKDQLKVAFGLSHLAFVLVGIMLGGWYGGTYVDDYFGTGTVFELVGFFLGFAAGLWYVIKEVLRFNKQESERRDDRSE